LVGLCGYTFSIILKGRTTYEDSRLFRDRTSAYDYGKKRKTNINEKQTNTSITNIKQTNKQTHK